MKQKVFITKYALTKGIIECEMELRYRDDGFIFCHGYIDIPNSSGYFYGDDFQLTKEDAIKYAEKRREDKVKIIKKKLLKLEKLSF